jgi:hypothetical protein
MTEDRMRLGAFGPLHHDLHWTRLCVPEWEDVEPSGRCQHGQQNQERSRGDEHLRAPPPLRPIRLSTPYRSRHGADTQG